MCVCILIVVILVVIGECVCVSGGGECVRRGGVVAKLVVVVGGTEVDIVVRVVVDCVFHSQQSSPQPPTMTGAPNPVSSPAMTQVCEV